jgi:hypothetical protein
VATNCAQCGAAQTELLCRFCGTTSAAVESLDDELHALRYLHSLIQYGSKKEQLRLLQTGFLPHHASVLIEAGLQCFVLIRDSDADDVSTAAAERLSTIATRLRLGKQDDAVRHAVAQFDERLKRYRRGQALLSWTASIVVLVIVGAGGWYWLAHRGH